MSTARRIEADTIPINSGGCDLQVSIDTFQTYPKHTTERPEMSTPPPPPPERPSFDSTATGSTAQRPLIAPSARDKAPATSRIKSAFKKLYLGSADSENKEPNKEKKQEERKESIRRDGRYSAEMRMVF